MKRFLLPLVVALPCLGAPADTSLGPPLGPELVSIRLRFALRPQSPADWEGSYRLTTGRILATDGWRFAEGDYATREKFRLSTREFYPLFWNRHQKNRKPNTEPNGVILTLAGVTDSTMLEVRTNHGDFAVPVGKLGYGDIRMLLKEDGNGPMVDAERVPTHRLVVTSPSEDAYPSAVAGPKGDIYVAYVAFTHGNGFRNRGRLDKEPKSLDSLDDAPGGDQLFFLAYRNGAWQAPVPLTPKGSDIFGTAVAASGNGNIWVVWAARQRDDWELFGRRSRQGNWGPRKRLTTSAGPDLRPALAVDVGGRTWLAWQSAREGNWDIWVTGEKGDSFGAPVQVSDSRANDWAPALATAPDGRLAVAWDSYAAGNYDVQVRQWDGKLWGRTQAVTSSPRNECRPSLVFDGQNRLWIAYEDCPEGWGKDSGPYDRSPRHAPLYRERRLGVRVLAGTSLLEPTGDVNPAMPTAQGTRRWPKAPKTFLSAAPRLTVDGNDRVWLSARCRMGRWISGAGTAWADFITSLDGQSWSEAVIVPGTDGLLHQAGSLVPRSAGGIVVVASSDGRMRQAAFFGPNQGKKRRRPAQAPPASTRSYATYPDQWVNWEIAAAGTGALPRPTPPELTLVNAATSPPVGPPSEAEAEAAEIAAMHAYRADIDGRQLRIWRGEFHRHTEISSDGGGDGSLFDMWRYAVDLAGLDWIGNGDHDNGGGREFTWWITQKTTDALSVPGVFTPMFSYERSCSYPDGHRNVVFARRGIRTLPRLRGGLGKALDELPADAKRPHTPDTSMLYRYLRTFDGVCASHTSGTDMGTDWRDNDPEVEPLVEIYQGDRQNYERPGAPRTNSAAYSMGGWRPLGFVSFALLKGYRLGFQSSSDHLSTHMSYCNVWVEEPTREKVLEAMKQRRVYGATDNIIADVRCGEHFMGEEFTLRQPPTLRVKLIGTAPFNLVTIVKDDEYVYSVSPKKRIVEFSWTDSQPTPGKTSYYYVRGEQEGETVTRKVRNPEGQPVEVELNNGELVWVSPMWIKYQP